VIIHSGPFPCCQPLVVKQSLHDIWQTETQKDAESAFDLFVQTYEAKYPKPVEGLQKDRDTIVGIL
jgi:hypothetical protein